MPRRLTCSEGRALGETEVSPAGVRLRGELAGSLAARPSVALRAGRQVHVPEPAGGA